MINGWRFRLFAILVFCLITAPAWTQETTERKRETPEFEDDSRRMELTVSFFLQGTGFNYIFLPEGRDSVNNTENSRLTGELRFSLFFDRYKTFGVEGTLAYTRAGGTFQQPADTSDPDNPRIFPIQNVKHSVLHYGANVIYNFGYLDVVPFVTAGAGINQFRQAEDSSFPLDGSYYNLSIGLGFKYFIKEWFGARVEINDLYYFLKGDQLNKNINSIRFQFGGVFTF